MEGLAAAVIAIAILLGALLCLVLIVFCLVHISTDYEVRYLPRWAWALIVVFLSPLGGVAYLVTQHLGLRDSPGRV